jgi:hypothetical protein
MNPAVISIWNGTSWSPSASPPTTYSTTELNDVSCVATNYCVAVGFTSGGVNSVPLVDVWDGTQWSVAYSSGPASDAQLLGVTCTGVAACVAVGTGITGGTGIFEWDGTNLQQTQAPSVADGFLWNVSCQTASHCTAVGYANQGSGSVAVIEELNGTTWSVPEIPQTSYLYNALYGASCALGIGCVATGYSQEQPVGSGPVPPKNEQVLVEMEMTSPPTQLPEVPYPVALPLVACSFLTIAYLVRRRRIQKPPRLAGIERPAVDGLPTNP